MWRGHQDFTAGSRSGQCCVSATVQSKPHFFPADKEHAETIQIQNKLLPEAAMSELELTQNRGNDSDSILRSDSGKSETGKKSSFETEPDLVSLQQAEPHSGTLKKLGVPCKPTTALKTGFTDREEHPASANNEQIKQSIRP